MYCQKNAMKSQNKAKKDTLDLLKAEKLACKYVDASNVHLIR